MIKINMSSFCKFCKKSVSMMYEEIVDKWVKKYHCGVCKNQIRVVKDIKE